MTRLRMVNIAAQLIEVEFELRALLKDIEFGSIDKREFKARMADLIQRQADIAKSLDYTDEERGR